VPNVTKKLVEYVREVLGVQLTFKSWPNRGKLPTFLVHAYQFGLTELYGVRCLLMIRLEDAEHALPSHVKRDWEQVAQVANCPCIYITRELSPYERGKLIEYFVPFIVPRNQMFLPHLGVDLRERFLRPPPEVQKVSPATQVFLIYVLNLGAVQTNYTTSDLVSRLGYTRMTIIRVLDELHAIQLGSQGKQGRERYWRWDGTQGELWQACQQWLRNPCRSFDLLWVSEPVGLRAGMTALSDYSMLAEPKIPIHAVSGQEWRELQNRGVEKFPEPQPGGIGLQVWKYDPRVVTSSLSVDPFSLYLSLLYPSLMDSLLDSGGERVEAAIDEMMEGVWS